eukprot:6101754-Alexandrium_andersonii.AAC.1
MKESSQSSPSREAQGPRRADGGAQLRESDARAQKAMKLDLTRGGAQPARWSSGAWRPHDSGAHMLLGRA